MDPAKPDSERFRETIGVEKISDRLIVPEIEAWKNHAETKDSGARVIHLATRREAIQAIESKKGTEKIGDSLDALVDLGTEETTGETIEETARKKRASFQIV
jgi:hypothetical protein